MDNQKLADLLFPNIDKKPEYYEEKYPERNLPEGTPVTRLGPSPTGFIHLGNLYGAFVDERLAHLNKGVFYLRIEDTDDKRYVEGAVDTIINSLDYFGITFDEGATKEGEKGLYGPYFQSARGEIYRCFVKKLIKDGAAYPCFLSEDEIGKIRTSQEANKLTPGIYGEYAKSRDLTFDEISEKIEKGEKYVIRLKSSGNPKNPREIQIKDAIRGKLKMPENFQDVVILKATGIPTYHFAHVCDDHLMRTTHVIRGEEWLSSLPIHYELFNLLEFKLPTYCHTGVLMKLDENNNKRKLSKRKDPELSLDFYKEFGYHPEAVREYLLTILNSNFEEWRRDNKELPSNAFPFTLEKMSKSGALFDINKLKDVSKDTLVRIPAESLYDFLITWAKEFKPEILCDLEDREYIVRILDIGRSGNKPRKDFINAGQMFDFINYFFDDYFKIEDSMPEETSKEDAKAILTSYLEGYNHKDTQEEWFNKIREIGRKLGYAAKPKDYKKNPDDYKGHVGHVSSVIRIAIVGRSQSPDVWEIQQILGEEKTKARIEAYLG